MKKIFDFKSENSILDKILKFIERKVPNFVVALLLTMVVGVSTIGLYIGFFVMPFISYSSMALKIIFSVLWVISCIVFICMAIDQFRQEKQDEKWSAVIVSACLIIFFGLCFVNNNYYHFGDWWQIAIIVAMGLYTALMIYWFIKELIKNPKGTLSALLMGVMLVFGFLCILSSSLNSLEMDLRKGMLVVGTICIAFPIIALLIAKILKISKAERALEYGSLIVLFTLLLIGISYVISFLNPNVDGYQTFVTLLASFLGGGLTLIGVAWTIKSEAKNRQDDLEKREQERKEEERKKAQPLFVHKILLNSRLNTDYICMIKSERKNIDTLACFVNSDNSNFIIRGVYINKKWHQSFLNNRVLKKQEFYLAFQSEKYCDEWEDGVCVLKIEDSLGEFHYYKLNYKKNWIVNDWI